MASTFARSSQPSESLPRHVNRQQREPGGHEREKENEVYPGDGQIAGIDIQLHAQEDARQQDEILRDRDKAQQSQWHPPGYAACLLENSREQDRREKRQ